ncbi:MAG: sulfite exporter TauE/SafE family protein [Gammaproteobacteria bacterium]|nr:sulfite exporter TauE/SafE family protein [Gammaproteobacteria bacterium]
MNLADPQLLTAFLAGLLGGAHCLGMCGGIVASLSFGLPQSVSVHNQSNLINRELIGYLFFYNLGRILSYTIAGMLVGGFTMMAANLININQVQVVLHLFAGLLMLALGLYLAGWWGGIVKIEQLGGPVWKKIEPISKQFIPVKSYKNAFFLGILWGWLPCGLVYTILFMAIASASLIQGGLIMLCFALGTFPMLMFMGVFAGSLREFVQNQFFRQMAGTSIMLFACYSLFLAYQSTIIK